MARRSRPQLAAPVLRAALGIALVATIAWSAMWLAPTDATYPPRYKAMGRADTADILDAAVKSGAQLYEAYSLSQAVGQVAPDATLVFPDGGRYERTWTGMRLSGYGKAADVASSTVPAIELWGRVAFNGDEETYSAPGLWDIVLDPDGDHSVLVHVMPANLDDPQLVIEATLIDASLDGVAE
ncbi:hypothetical protein ON058_02445 [Demequina sp. B12]|uniref:hypothetical protein n=1 Tax=Demequina sp. B12 TaxID=2992757 RepID=UPI00237A76F2|nr:hypothetical protein [Demequina sp. B12]MDE0572271.1 hypothetical protein [Demequina sp. B12]